MSYTTLSLTVFTQQPCADFLQVKCSFSLKMAILRFWAPRSTWGNVRCSSDAYWKASSGLPVSDIELFFAIGVTAEAIYERTSIKNRRFCRNGVRLAQNFRYKGSSPPTMHASCRKTTIIDFWYGIKIWQKFLFCHNSRVWQSDGHFSHG